MRHAPLCRPREGGWKVFGSASLLRLSSIICFATKQASNEILTEPWTNSSVFSGCAGGNLSCQNLKYTTLFLDDLSEQGPASGNEKLQNELRQTLLLQVLTGKR